MTKKQLIICSAPSFAFAFSMLEGLLFSSAIFLAHYHQQCCSHLLTSLASNNLFTDTTITCYTLLSVVAECDLLNIIITAFNACGVSVFNTPSHDFAPLIESVLVSL